MNQLAFLQGKQARHGDVFPVRPAAGSPLLVVGAPELAKQVFTAPPDVLRAGDGNRRALGWLLGEHSLILLDEERHMRHRRLLLPPFHGGSLKRHAATMRAVAEEQLDAWPTGETVALPRMRTLSLEVVLRVLFGSDVGEPLRGAVRTMLMPAEERQGARPGDADSVRRAEASVAKRIAERRDASRSDEAEDVLSALLAASDEEGSPLTDEEIRDELMTLIVAGTETTAASLAWALERLCRFPAALDRASAEAAEGAGPYIEAVIRETLRMRPAVPMSAARLVQRDFRLGDRSIPPGTTIVVSALVIHHRADIYSEPMRFRPERFLQRKPDAYSWIPFGGGVRRCVGGSFAMVEMQIVLAALLARFVPRAPDAEPEGLRSRSNLLVPAGGARLTLKPAARRGR